MVINDNNACGMDMGTRRQRLSVSEIMKLVRGHPGTVVLLKCDPPEDFQFWFAPFSACDLEKWWLERDTFNFNPDGVWDSAYKVFGETPPPHRSFDVPGLFDLGDSWELYRLWKRLRKLKRYYGGKICCDDDSYLERPDGNRLFHLGFRGDRSARLLLMPSQSTSP